MKLDFRTGGGMDHGEDLDIRMLRKGGGKMLSATNFHAEFGERVMLWTIESFLPHDFKDRETGKVDRKWVAKFEEHPQAIRVSLKNEYVVEEAWGRKVIHYTGKQLEVFVEPYRSRNSSWSILFRVPEQARRQDPNYPDQNQSNYQF